MTGNEILAYAESRINRELDPSDILLAINEALDMLGDRGLLYDKVENIEVTDTSQWYNLPKDFTYIEKVMTSKGELYLNWEYINGQISFSDENTYNIIARKMAKHLTTITDALLEIHRAYHSSIKFYVVGWIKENDDDDDPAAQKYYERFERTSQEAALMLLSTKSPTSWKVIRHV